MLPHFVASLSSFNFYQYANNNKQWQINFYEYTNTFNQYKNPIIKSVINFYQYEKSINEYANTFNQYASTINQCENTINEYAIINDEYAKWKISNRKQNRPKRHLVTAVWRNWGFRQTLKLVLYLQVWSLIYTFG